MTDSCSDIKILIMDYLVQEAYPDVAKSFAEEASIEMVDEDAFMEERAHIRQVIIQGDVQAAIEEIGNIDAQVSQNRFLSFNMMIQVSCTTHSFRDLMIANTDFSPQSDSLFLPA